MRFLSFSFLDTHEIPPSLSSDSSDISDEVTEAPDGLANISEDLADASEDMNDSSDDIIDTADDLADNADEVSNVSENQSESSSESITDDQPDVKDANEVADQDIGIDDEIDNAEIDLSQSSLVSEDMPDDIDLTAPISEDASEPDEDAANSKANLQHRAKRCGKPCRQISIKKTM